MWRDTSQTVPLTRKHFALDHRLTHFRPLRCHPRPRKNSQLTQGAATVGGEHDDEWGSSESSHRLVEVTE